MDVFLRELFDLAGSLICHQLSDRSLTAGGVVLPVCARDTGIYVGIFTAFVYLAVTRRLNAQRPPGLGTAIVMAVMMAPMMFDGALSYTGIIETNNAVRLFTGLFFGLPIPILLVPAAHFDADGQNIRQVLKQWTDLIVVYGAGILACILLLHGLVPYIAAGFIYVAGLLCLITRIVYTLVRRSGLRSGWKLCAATVLGSASTLTLLYFLSSYILQPLKEMLVKGL
jgi:uncharacterized membrane protein